MRKKLALSLILLSIPIISACENTSAEDLVNQYAKDRAAEAASAINEKIDSNEKAKEVKDGITTAGEYAEDAYDYVTDKDTINGVKESANEGKNQAKNFFDYMMGELSDSWDEVKQDLTRPTSEFDDPGSLEDASEFDFYGDYTNPWKKAQGIDTSSEGTALNQFKMLIGKASEQAKDTAQDIKDNHDAKHPAKTETKHTGAETNTYTTQALSNALLNAVPAYSGYPYVIVNDNVPFFDESELTTEVFEVYSDLDSLGRCGVAYANVCKDIMPDEERGSIGQVKPTGWNQSKYDILKDEKDNPQGYYQCRMHLIAYTLAGENANGKNLITGTFYCNVQGMEPFELATSYYVKSTDHHVLYRVTPIFNENELMARGVLMEAKSVEDDELSFCVYCYNVAPGINIDYATGKSSE